MITTTSAAEPRYGRDLSQKGKSDAWISCELDFKDSIPERFYVVLRDGVHAMSMDITKERLREWLQYIERHEGKVYTAESARLQVLGLGDKTYGQVMSETVEADLKDGHSLEDIINYHEHWDWEKFSAEGEF